MHARDTARPWATPTRTRKYLTPKDHNIEGHFADMLTMHGQLGALSEESMESWHAIGTRFRRIVRCVVKPEEFQESLMRHHARFQHSTEKPRES